jgi:hypothetical protein
MTSRFNPKPNVVYKRSWREKFCPNNTQKWNSASSTQNWGGEFSIGTLGKFHPALTRLLTINTFIGSSSMGPRNFLPPDRFVKTIDEISERMDTLTKLFIYADTPERLAEIAEQLDSLGFRLHRLSADVRALRSMN